MKSSTVWLPRPGLRDRRSRFHLWKRQSFRSRGESLSAFLTEDMIVFLDRETTLYEAADRLIRRFPVPHQDAIHKHLWTQELQGSLRVDGRGAILRARAPKVHHIRCALGLSRDGLRDPLHSAQPLHLVLVFTGPVNQTRLHLNFIVASAAIFHREDVCRRLLRSAGAAEALGVLHEAEHPTCTGPGWIRSLKTFLENRYGL